jgi:hypothetical protein
MLGKDKLTQLADSAFETMEAESPPDSFVGAAMLIVEMRIREGGDNATAFYVVSTDSRGWVQRALLEEARVAQVFAPAEG